MKRIVLLFFTLAFFTGLYAKPELKKLDSIVKKEIRIIKGDPNFSIKDSILYQKLSAEQLIDLRREENRLELQRIEAANKNDMPLNGFGIVMIVLMPFLLIFSLALIITKTRTKESLRRYDLYNKSLEMGQTIPEHFFDTPKKQSDRISNLKKGIIWLAVGLALVVYFIIIVEYEPLILGILPTFVGSGYLLVHFLEKPKSNDEQDR